MMDQIFLEYEYSKMYSDKTRQWYKIKGDIDPTFERVIWEKL